MSFDVLKTRFAAGMTSYVERDVKLCTITKTSSVAAGFGRHDMPRPPTTLTFDLETGVRVASKVGNLPSKYGHARLLRSQITRYVRDKWKDRRTDGQKQCLCPLPNGHRHNNDTEFTLNVARKRTSLSMWPLYWSLLTATGKAPAIMALSFCLLMLIM